MKHHQLMRPLLLLTAAAANTGCTADTANEEPVAILNGRYEVITNSDNAVGQLARADGQGAFQNRTCLFAKEDSKKVEQLLLSQAGTDDCTNEPGERTGNAISGTAECMLGPGFGYRYQYIGVVQANAVTIKATQTAIKRSGEIDDTPSVLIFDAKRVGDCTKKDV